MLPICPDCKKVPMIPLSDQMDTAPIMFKAWACVDRNCGYVVRIDRGVVVWSNKEYTGPSGHGAKR